jgi:hypothetical protein
MAPRSKHNLDVFRTEVKNGKTKNEIMETMSIKNATTFNSILLRLMETDKKYYTVKDSKEKTSKKIQKATIGKNNTLTLSAMMLSDTVFQTGDAFVVKISKNKIALTLIED